MDLTAVLIMMGSGVDLPTWAAARIQAETHLYGRELVSTEKVAALTRPLIIRLEAAEKKLSELVSQAVAEKKLSELVSQAVAEEGQHVA
jgi:hypothetical protein